VLRPEKPLRHEYLRPPVPLFFPAVELVPETGLHQRLRTALFLILDRKLRGRAYVGSDQFVYWDSTNPKLCLAPDAFVRLGGPSEFLRSYQTWKHGAPEVAVEILSDKDGGPRALERRLERYRQCAVEELVHFDPDDRERPLRLWDCVESDLVERNLAAPNALYCDALEAYWCLWPDPQLGVMLRVADGPDGSGLWPTPEEAAEAAERDRDAAERDRDAAQRDRDAVQRDRDAAQRRVAELEAELRRRGSPA
jgi:Uma2 family endonuclease